jgi:hypothetical protein
MIGACIDHSVLFFFSIMQANLKFDKRSKATRNSSSNNSSGNSSSSCQRLHMQGLLGVQASTAPSPLRVLLMSPHQLQWECSMPAGYTSSSSGKGTDSSGVIAVDCSHHIQQQQTGRLKDTTHGSNQQQQQLQADQGSVAAAAAEAERVLRSAGLWKGAAEAPVSNSS